MPHQRLNEAPPPPPPPPRGVPYNNDDHNDDHTPLLGHQHDENNNNHNTFSCPRTRPKHGHRRTTTASTIGSIIAPPAIPTVHGTSAVLFILLFIVFLISCAMGFVGLPLARIVEDALCHDYYRLPLWEPIPEKRCKVETVQADMAFVISLTTAITAIVGLFAAFPWGLAADRWGRKPVLAISLLGVILGLVVQMIVLAFHNVFPIELVWLGSAAPILGGGNAVLIGLINSIVVDETTEENRSVVFMRFHVASLCTELISPSLAGLMMEKKGPWPTFAVGIACLTAGAIGMLFIPETSNGNKAERGEQEVFCDDDDDDEREGTAGSATNRSQSAATEEVKVPESRIAHILGQFRESLSIVKSPSLILLFIVTLLSVPSMNSTTQFMLQYISERYDVDLDQTGYVQSLYGFAHILVSLLVLPSALELAIKLMKRRRGKGLEASLPHNAPSGDEQRRDIIAARVSYAILAFAGLFLGLAPRLPGFLFGLVLMALASGYSSLTKSLMSMYVDPNHRSRLFALVGMTDALGRVYSDPMLATLFTVGLKLEGGWIGLPYFGAAGLAALATVLILFVRLPRRVKLPESEDAAMMDGAEDE